MSAFLTISVIVILSKGFSTISSSIASLIIVLLLILLLYSAFNLFGASSLLSILHPLLRKSNKCFLLFLGSKLLYKKKYIYFYSKNNYNLMLLFYFTANFDK